MIGQSDALREKADAARRQAYDEELTRLEKEISFRGQEAFQRWLADEETQHRNQLDQARAEREAQIRTLKNREVEFLRQLEEEERRKFDDVRRRRDEEERRKRDEEERRRRQLEEEERKRQKSAGASGPSKEELQRIEKSRGHLTAAETLLTENNYEAALAEVSKALGLMPIFPEAASLQDKIRQAQRAAKEESEKMAAEWAEAGTPGTAPRRKSYLKQALIAAVVIIAAVAGYFLLQNRATLFPETVSVAILPFSGDLDDPFIAALSTALPREINTRLQPVAHLRVLGSASALAVRRHASDPMRVVAGMGFPNIVTGTLTHDGGNIALTLALLDSTGNNRWSHTYQNIGNDNGEVLDVITADLMSAANIRDGDDAILPSKKFSTPAAFQAYLRGTAIFGRGETQDRTAALDAFSEGLKADPESPLLLLGAARVSISLARDMASQAQYLPMAEEYVKKLQMADGENPHVVMVSGMLRAVKREYATASSELRKAAKRLPGSTEILLMQAHVGLETGAYDDAVSALSHALEVDPRNPRLLELFGFAQQLNGAPGAGIRGYEAAIENGRDSTGMLIGPISDALFYDPELLANYGGRVVAASRAYIAQNPNDLEAVYRLARVLQTIGTGLEWNTILGQLKNSAEQRLRGNPNDGITAVLLARTLTRLGRFPEGTRYAKQALAANTGNPEIMYKAAEMYAVQMFSLKTNQVDSLKKEEALQLLRAAVGLEFRLPEIVNGDFYNFREDADFKKAIQVPAR